MGLSTHILDLVTGQPAEGVRLALFFNGAQVHTDITNRDGRCTLMDQSPLSAGRYRVVFGAGEYLKRTQSDAGTPFFDDIQVDFVITDTQRHYHVPLLLSPFGYSTYRGS